jgi:hypothetical protein
MLQTYDAPAQCQVHGCNQGLNYRAPARIRAAFVRLAREAQRARAAPNAGTGTGPCLLRLRHRIRRRRSMKSLAAIAAALLICGATSAANAKGCIKGAVVGGVAGHYAGHHGVLGAAAGCLYGRHHAKEQQQQERQRQQQSQVNGQGKLLARISIGAYLASIPVLVGAAYGVGMMGVYVGLAVLVMSRGFATAYFAMRRLGAGFFDWRLVLANAAVFSSIAWYYAR